MANKHKKRCPTLLIIREMKTKITRYHFTIIKMAIIKTHTQRKKKQQNISVVEDAEKS